MVCHSENENERQWSVVRSRCNIVLNWLKCGLIGSVPILLFATCSWFSSDDSPPSLSLELRQPFDVRQDQGQWLSAYRCGRDEELSLVAERSGAPQGAIPLRWQWADPLQPGAESTLEWHDLPASETCPASWPAHVSRVACTVGDFRQLFPACPERSTDRWQVRAIVETPEGTESTSAEGLLVGTDAHLSSSCRQLLETASPLGNSTDQDKRKEALPIYEQALEQCRQADYLDSAGIAWRGILSLQRKLGTLSAQEILTRGQATLPLQDDRFALQRAKSLGLLERIAREAGHTSVAATQLQELMRLAALTGHPELALQSTQAQASFGLATAGWAMAWRGQLENEALVTRLNYSSDEPLARERGVEIRRSLGLYDAALSDAARTYQDVITTEASVRGSPERANTNLGFALLDLPTVSSSVIRILLDATGPRLRSSSRADVLAALAQAEADLSRSPRAAMLSLAEALFLVNYWAFDADNQNAEQANEALNLARLALVRAPARLEDAQHWLTEAQRRLDQSPAVIAERHRELAELQLELALQQRKLPDAERLAGKLRALEGERDDQALRELELSEERSILLEARLQALAGDRSGAVELYRLAAEEVAESAAQAGLAGFSQGYLMHHRAAGDRLLEMLPLQSAADAQSWLEAYAAIHASRCLPVPEAQEAAGVSGDDWARFDTLSRQRAAVRRKQLEVVSRERALLEAELQRLEPEWRAAWLKVNPCIPSASVPVSVPTLQQSLPEDGEIWVLASLAERVRGVRIRKSELSPLSVPVARDRIHLLRQQFVDRTEMPPPPAGEVQAVLEALSALIPPNKQERQRVALVLDPFLAGIPFELLPLSGGLLGQESALSYAEGLEALGRRGAASGRAPDIATSGTAILPTGEPVPPLRRVLVGVELGVSDASTQAHATKLKAAMTPHVREVVLLTGSELTLERLREHARDATLLHLMIHGKASPFDPLAAQLRLQTRELSVLELQGLPLENRVVLLTACQSGPGGVHGAALVRALHAAGARTVLASRWLLPQEDVEALVPGLYGGLARGLGLAEALRSAVVSSPRAASLLGQLWISGDPGW